MFRNSVIVAYNNISCTYIVIDARDDCSVPAAAAAVVPAVTVFISATDNAHVATLQVIH